MSFTLKNNFSFNKIDEKYWDIKYIGLKFCTNTSALSLPSVFADKLCSLLLFEIAPFSVLYCSNFEFLLPQSCEQQPIAIIQPMSYYRKPAFEVLPVEFFVKYIILQYILLYYIL